MPVGATVNSDAESNTEYIHWYYSIYCCCNTNAKTLQHVSWFMWSV